MSFCPKDGKEVSRGGILTSKDQITWTQRIEKEEKVNTKINPDGFSVLGAISKLDVPRRFKPGHIDPHRPPPDEGFKKGTKDRKELEFRLREREAPRRDRYLWPETDYQEHGWFQKDPASGPEKPGRTTMTGTLPKTNGIGWRDKRYEDKVYKKIAPEGLHSLSAANDKEYFEKPPPPRPVERPPFAFVSREAMQKVHAKRAQEGGGIVRGGEHSGADRRSRSLGVLGHATDPTPKAPTTPSGSRLLAANKSISEGQLGVMTTGSKIHNPDDHLCTESFDGAMARQRIFRNRHPKNQWYTPLGSTDATHYVDHFTKCFGLPFYGKSSQKGDGEGFGLHKDAMKFSLDKKV